MKYTVVYLTSNIDGSNYYYLYYYYYYCYFWFCFFFFCTKSGQLFKSREFLIFEVFALKGGGTIRGKQP